MIGSDQVIKKKTVFISVKTWDENIKLALNNVDDNIRI
jgi:hypothetical protein